MKFSGTIKKRKEAHKDLEILEFVGLTKGKTRVFIHSVFSSKTDSPQSEICCFLFLSFSIYSFPQGHPIAAYVFFLNIPSLLYCLRKNAGENKSS